MRVSAAYNFYGALFLCGQETQFATLALMESILRWLKSCPLCFSLVGPVDGCCSRCLRALLVNCGPELHVVSGLPFAVRSLLVWTDDWDQVGGLVKSLKGPWSRRAYAKLAEEFLRRANQRYSGIGFVVPPSRNGRADHAHAFAEGFSTITGVKVESPFERVVDGTQKERDRVERFKLEYRLKSRPKAEAFIFVDDLLTTGSTASAAWRALGKPKCFSAWTLACRPLQKLL